MTSATRLFWKLVLHELQRARAMVSVEHANWNRVQWLQWGARVGLKAMEHQESARGWANN
jgi:hypothetical protein